MALTHTPPGELGMIAPPFKLRAADGQAWSLESFWSARALVVVFMCNHCPYVKAVTARVNALAREIAPRGGALVAINPNDSSRYPDDSPAEMLAVARRDEYAFPYLVDESQAVARAYGAVCTPDFYAFAREGGQWRLHYRGRLDDSWKDESAVTTRDLARAVDGIFSRAAPLATQPPSMGCSIKWKP